MDARISITEGMIVLLDFALAIGGVLSGVALLSATDGTNLGWSTDSLVGTAFSDYTVPALMFLLLNGIFPLVVAIATLQRRPWSLWGHLVMGGLSVAWIGGLIMMIGYISLLQPIFGAIAFVITTLALVVMSQARNESRIRELAPSRRIAPAGVR
ncbi:hypothetical protein [Enhygromyxa salina]|uniref:Uncharacterized protein n=1 Tax=Enhygromyxa salina TaxID=215803 RepID=A0A2S9YHQ0_9BACT|nr:hypothetical protein [Enhygromyxa salina]PRQ04581.1 hypothetical protein ENSA7_50720 [Enhygromyxa salina]